MYKKYAAALAVILLASCSTSSPASSSEGTDKPDVTASVSSAAEDTSETVISPDILLSMANANARHVFNAANDYATYCEIEGHPVTEGKYIFTLTEEAGESAYDGAHLGEALNAEMGYDGGYAAVFIAKSGYPYEAYWSAAPIEDTGVLSAMAQLDAGSINDGKAVGRYPGEITFEGKSTYTPQALLDEANSHAKEIFSNAAVYSTDVMVSGGSISEGWYTFALSADRFGCEYSTDGSDIEGVLNSFMGNIQGSAAVHINAEGNPDKSVWSDSPITEGTEDSFFNTSSLSASDIEGGKIFGTYPSYISFAQADGSIVLPEDSLPPDELLEKANSNAKYLFSNAATYATLCEVEGTPVPEGWHTFRISADNYCGEYRNDGTDIENAMSSFMGDVPGYGAVRFDKDSCPDAALWAYYPISAEDAETIMTYKAVDKDDIKPDTVAGRYPDGMTMK